ncbi:uncharacterized protein LOC113278456 [Papaver somniferum]|uniref:uncharacterized protein LOC113278456 n=1 Tax=Papaver somniferum TaxID=3469 RepID=UPI000E6F487F|nr:uncharacterized protein LOC113278456 [Papaver somniferum]
MKASIFRPQFSLPIQTNLKTPTTTTKFLHLLPFRTKSRLSNSCPPQKTNLLATRKATIIKKLQNPAPSNSTTSNDENGLSRVVILGAVTLGVAMLVVGMDDQKALALGPEGPLMEEFWDNMRRYSLYIVTVSTGVIYTIFTPILELLKNPITAILIITILGGSLFIVSQVISAMVGTSEFVYDYGY